MCLNQIFLCAQTKFFMHLNNIFMCLNQIFFICLNQIFMCLNQICMCLNHIFVPKPNILCIWTFLCAWTKFFYMPESNFFVPKPNFLYDPTTFFMCLNQIFYMPQPNFYVPEPNFLCCWTNWFAICSWYKKCMYAFLNGWVHSAYCKKVTIRSIMCVCLAVRLYVRMEQLHSNWTDCHEIWYLNI